MCTRKKIKFSGDGIHMRVTVILVVIGALRTVPKDVQKSTGRVGNLRMIQDYPDYGIVEIDKNTEKSPGDLRRLAVVQSLVKYH